MAMSEAELKEIIKTGGANLYLLYGAEGYLVEQYARLVTRYTVEEGFDAFNLQRFDGQEVTLEQLEEAVEALPLMTARKCVLVRDYDAASGDTERFLRLVGQVPDSCVLVFWQMTVQPDSRKRGWKDFLEIAQKSGVVMNFERKTVTDIAKMLVSGAKRRGTRLDMEDARYLVEQVGNDLNLLLCELDKLCALGGEQITRGHIDTACAKNLEARVFDLSKAILRRRPGDAYDLLQQLKVQRQEPVTVLGALSTAYADLYRAKVAAAAGVPSTALLGDFKSYKNKEFRLRNAARDVSRLGVPLLRDSLDILAQTDTALKMSSGMEWVLLEQAVTRLIARVQEG